MTGKECDNILEDISERRAEISMIRSVLYDYFENYLARIPELTYERIGKYNNLIEAYDILLRRGNEYYMEHMNDILDA